MIEQKYINASLNKEDISLESLQKHEKESEPTSKSTKSKSMSSIMSKFIMLLVFIIPWVFAHYTYEFYEISKNTVLIFGVIILILFWALKVAYRKKLTIMRTPFDVPILIFLISQIVSTVFSIYKPTSIWGYYSRFTGGLISTLILILLYYIIVNNVTTKKTVLKIIDVVTLSITLLALFVILKSFGVFNPIFSSLVDSHPSLSFLLSPLFTPVGNPDVLPIILLGVLPLVLSLISKRDKDIGKQLLSIISGCLILFAIGITAYGSPGVYNVGIWMLAFGIIVAVIMSKFPINSNILLRFVPIVLFAAFSMIFSFYPQVREVIHEQIQFSRYEDTPFDTSWSIIMGTFREYNVKGFLIGTGPDTYGYNFTRFRPVEQNLQPNWHQNYTRSGNHIFGVLTDSGVIGLIAFILFSIITIGFIVKRILAKEIRGSLVSPLGISIVAILLSSVLISYSITIYVMLWVFMSLMVVVYYLENKREKERYELSFFVSKSKIAVENEREILPYVFLVVSVSILLVCSFFVTKNYIAEVQYKKSLVALSYEDNQKAYDEIIFAVRKIKSRDYYHRQLAYVALQALKQSLGESSTQDDSSIQTYQNYLVNLIYEEINEARILNPIDAVNWETAAVIFKQLVDLSGGKLYGNETLYAANQAISLNPYNPDNYIVLGYIFQYNENEDNREKAESIFVQAYNLQPSYPLSIFALGNYLEFVEKFDEATLLYENSIARFYSEGTINQLLEDRILLVEEKKQGALESELEQVPSEEDITEEVEENIMEPSFPSDDEN